MNLFIHTENYGCIFENLRLECFLLIVDVWLKTV